MISDQRKSSPNASTSTSATTSVKSSIRQFLHKCRTGLHRISKEALESDSEEDEGHLEGLFDSDAKDSGVRGFSRISEERNSSTSVPLTREMRLTDDEEEDEDCNSSADSSSGPSSREVASFSKYDAVHECAKLRSRVGEPFVQADQIWRRRRDLWCKPVQGDHDRVARDARECFSELSPRHYVRVYRKLVVEGLPLKRALNLQDAIKVINAGWVETNKWERAASGLA
ncbi:LADA_0H13190g1_1 [Lachancea dasiensis]|uniref:LADA_0H13190g1_1 n=1 Tax=Lachancea dasiensis TaxID=1072105 RepID=A0A1G4K499_9SACH|nr:LADA_0H13190g1_1 [Lachancea dasiensis]